MDKTKEMAYWILEKGLSFAQDERELDAHRKGATNMLNKLQPEIDFLAASREAAVKERDELKKINDQEYKHSCELSEHWYNYMEALREISKGTASGYYALQNIASGVLLKYPQINSREHKTMMADLRNKLAITQCELLTAKDELIKAREEASAYRKAIGELQHYIALGDNFLSDTEAINSPNKVLAKYPTINPNT